MFESEQVGRLRAGAQDADWSVVSIASVPV